MGGRVRGRLLDGIIAGLLTGHFMPDLSQFREFICNDFFKSMMGLFSLPVCPDRPDIGGNKERDVSYVRKK